MLPAHIAVCIYIMTGKADAPTASRAAGDEPVDTPVPPPDPVLSPSSDETTEAAVEEQSAPVSPSPADTAPAVSATVPAEGDSGTVSGSPPPEAWGAIMSFLDRPQEARQSALASLPTSDLIRLTLEASPPPSAGSAGTKALPCPSPGTRSVTRRLGVWFSAQHLS